MITKDKDLSVVYSTEQGTMCPACGEPEAKCVCCRNSASPPGDGIVRVGRITKGCRGKGLTVITGVPMDHDGLVNLARQFKQKCGAGGMADAEKISTVFLLGGARHLSCSSNSAGTSAAYTLALKSPTGLPGRYVYRRKSIVPGV